MPAKLSAHRASANAIATGAREIKKATNKTWRLAPKAPMYTRKPNKQTPKGEKKVVRTKRLISNHAFKIHASGGAAYANAIFQNEAKAYRLDIGRESKRVPWLPSVSPGAIALLEQFLCAYAQSATQNAVDVREGLKSHKRLSGKLMKLGYDQADSDIFGSTMPAPRTTIICTPVVKKLLAAGMARMAMKPKKPALSYAQRGITRVPFGAVFSKLSKGAPIASARDLRDVESALDTVYNARSANQFIEAVDRLVHELATFTTADLMRDQDDTELLTRRRAVIKNLENDKLLAQQLADVLGANTPQDPGEFDASGSYSAALTFLRAAQDFHDRKMRTMERESNARTSDDAERRRQVQLGLVRANSYDRQNDRRNDREENVEESDDWMQRKSAFAQEQNEYALQDADDNNDDGILS